MWIKKEIFPCILLCLNFLTMIMNYLLSFSFFFLRTKVVPRTLRCVPLGEPVGHLKFLPASQVAVMGSSPEPSLATPVSLPSLP